MYLQVKQAAVLLGVSRQSVHTWINRKRLATVEIAGRRLVVQDGQFKALQKGRNEKN